MQVYNPIDQDQQQVRCSKRSLQETLSLSLSGVKQDRQFIRPRKLSEELASASIQHIERNPSRIDNEDPQIQNVNEVSSEKDIQENTLEILRDDRLLEEQRLFDGRYHIGSDYESRGSSYEDSQDSETESNSGKEQQDSRCDSDSKCASNKSKFTTSDFYSDGKSQVSLPPIPTKVVTLIIPDNASERSNIAAKEDKPKVMENNMVKPQQTLLGNKRLYLKSFQKINLAAPQEMPTKKVIIQGDVKPEPIDVPRFAQKSRSESNNENNRIDLGKFDFTSTPSTSVHVDNSQCSQENCQPQLQSSRPIVNKRAKKSKKDSLFLETLEKAKELASIFKGKAISENQFSICKGQFSIRFNCINEHNFYLSADQINSMDLRQIKSEFRSYRKQMHSLLELSEQCKEKVVTSKIPMSQQLSCCWCPRCTDFFNHCEASHNPEFLNIVGGLFTKQIMYQCKYKPSHLFHVQSVRKHAFQKQYRIHDYRCPECKKEMQAEQRRLAAEEQARREKEIADQQQALFQESIENMKREAEELEREEMRRKANPHYWQTWQQTQEWHQQQEERRQEQERNDRVKKMCKEFVLTVRNLDQASLRNAACSTSIKSDIQKIESDQLEKVKALSIQQVWMIYNFLETPATKLVESLQDKSEDDVKKYYRNIALQLHPDKNSHPRSKEAFQKILSVIEHVNQQRKSVIHGHGYYQKQSQYSY